MLRVSGGLVSSAGSTGTHPRGAGHPTSSQNRPRAKCVRVGGGADAGPPRIPPADTAAHQPRTVTPGTHTRRGRGTQLRVSAEARRPRPPPADPRPRRRGAGTARLAGAGGGGEVPPPRLRPPPPLGAGRTLSPLPPPPYPRQASPRAPPGAPLTREREWGSVRGRVGSNSDLSDLNGAGRPPQIERDRSCARPRAGTAPLRAPRPPQGEWRGTPKPALAPSLPPGPAPRAGPAPPAPAPPAAHSEVSCAARGHAPGSLAAALSSLHRPPSPRPRPAPIGPAVPSAPGQLPSPGQPEP